MASNRARETSMEVTVGAFMLMVLLALSFFTIVLSQQALFTETWPLEVTFEDVMGVREGDHVYLRGVQIGNVRRIRLEEGGVRLICRLTQPLELREDYRIELQASSVLGGRYVNIREGSPDLPLLAPDTPLVGETPVDVFDEAARAVVSLREAIEEEGGVLDRVAAVAENVDEVVARIGRGEGSLGRLLVEEGLYEDLAASVAGLRETVAAVSEGRGTLGRLLQDEGRIHEDIAAVTAELRGVAERLGRGEGLAGRLLGEDDTVYADLQAAAQAVRAVLEAVEEGEGTIGRLARDPGLYDDIRLLIHEVRATVDDFRETTPITTFTSILFGVF